MSKARYQDSVDRNPKIKELIKAYLEKKDESLLLEAFNLLRPITDGEINRVYSKVGQCDYRDMLQEAYLKLRDVCQWYDEQRCPVFITWWRTAVYRHLLSLHYKQDIHKELQTDVELSNEEDATIATIFLAEIEQQYTDEILSWSGMHAKLRPMMLAVLKRRILSDDPPSQAALASLFDVSQGYLAIWEKWLLNKIRKDHPEGFS